MAKGSGKPIPKVPVNLKVSSKQAEELLGTLQARFEENMARHKGLEWPKIQAKLQGQPEKLASLNAMETTGGEPDVVAYDKKTDEYIFYDCSAETPNRRSICYDGEGEEERKRKGYFPAAMRLTWRRRWALNY